MISVIVKYRFIVWVTPELSVYWLTPNDAFEEYPWSQDNYNVRRLYKRATKMASLSIPHSNFLFLGQFHYWSTHYQLRSMARYVTPVHNHKRRIKRLQGEQGRRSGESTRLPPMLPGVNSRRRRHICGLRLFLVLSLAPRSFSPGNPVFPSPQKPTFPNSNLTRNHLQIVIVFIYYYYY